MRDVPMLPLLLSLLLFAATPMAANGTGASPPGFTPLFNGTDLSGWWGLGHTDPRQLDAMSAAELAALKTRGAEDVKRHWRVENGEIVNDGQGVYLTTEETYEDFELRLDWRMMTPGTDSGIYLRGCPQVQIWDVNNESQRPHGNDKGSGGLWNNDPGSAGRFPSEVADHPVGEWNTLHIVMVGSRVTVDLNGKRIVHHATMHNYWDRTRPLFRRGPIQLQTHGGEMRFRNIALRRISPNEANEMLRSRGADGFEPIFNGKDLSGWEGPIDDYEVSDGALRCKPHHGGTIYTEKEYGDFVARLDVQLPPGGNNGLAIRYPGAGDTAYVGMCELQVLENTAEKFATLDPRQYHGSAYGMVPAHRGYQRRPGEWNFQQVTVRGSTIRVELNGYVILDCDLAEVTEFMGGHPHPGKDRDRGHFGFAGHHDPVLFRNVAIKVLE